MTTGSEGSPWLGANTDALIERVLQAMASPHPDLNGIKPFKLEKLLGKVNITSQASPPMMVWVPLFEDYTNAHEQPDDGAAMFEANTSFDVYCWGETQGQAEDMRNTLFITLATQFSNNAAKPGGRGDWNPDNVDVLGARVKVRVMLRVPIYTQVWMDGQINTVNATAPTTTNASVSDVDGQNPEDLE
jgi:hypothetical protein